MIDWDLLVVQIIDASVVAVNATAFNVAERAKAKAPVRKVFRGGRQTVRFKTAAEIGADRAMRAALGLAPEILAAPGESLKGSTSARVVTHRNRANTFKPGGLLRAQVGTLGPEGPGQFSIARPIVRNKASKVGSGQIGQRNRYEPQDLRLLDPRNEVHLANPMAERELTSRGRYELKRPMEKASFNQETGKITITYSAKHGDHLGGALRSSIRVEKANRGQFPIIKASVVAGGGKVTYAKYQELGTRHNPAHPFLRPALAGARDELPAQLRRAFGRLGR